MLFYDLWHDKNVVFQISEEKNNKQFSQLLNMDFLVDKYH